MTINLHQRIIRKRMIFFTIILFYLLNTTSYKDVIENAALLKSNIKALGSLGPVIIILSMIVAIIMSPIPIVIYTGIP